MTPAAGRALVRRAWRRRRRGRPAAGLHRTATTAATARINLRLPEHLKGRIEEAAGQAGLSVNAWLVRAAAAALERRRPPAAAPTGAPPRAGQRFTGWVR